MPTVYHAHIYFSPEQSASAAALYARLPALLPASCELGRLHQREVGPHTQPMFAISFDSSLLPAITALLTAERGDLSVLLHPELADEVTGHTSAATWLGAPLPLKIDTLSRG